MARRHRFALVVVFVASFLSPWSVGQSAPKSTSQLTLDPPSAAPGTTVTASGWDFPPDTDGVVSWDADGAILASFRVDQAGTVWVQFQVPAFPSGSYSVSAVAGEGIAQAQFEVLPEPTPIPEPTATDVPPSPTATFPPPTATFPPPPTDTPMPTPTETASAPEPTAGPTELSLLPAADSWVGREQPDANHGTDLNLLVDREPPIESLLRFDVNGVSGSVTTATLRVYVHDRAGIEPDVYLADNGWQESAVTWNTRPARTSGKIAGNGHDAAEPGWLEYDVRPVVATNGTYTFVLATRTKGGTDLFAREGPHPPELVLTVDPTGAPSSPPTPIPTETPTPATAESPTAAQDATSTTAPTATATATVTATEPSRLGAAVAQNVVLAPDADASVSGSNPSTNYGTDSTLLVDGSPLLETYIRFDASKLTGVVTSALLRLFVADATTRPTSAYGTSNSWTEAGITWSNRPARTTASVFDVPSAAVGTWIEYDVTSLVRAGAPASFVIATASSDGLDVSSSEGTRPPQLFVTTDGSGTPSPFSVEIVSPASGTTVTTPQSVVITASVSAGITISRVEFFEDGALQGSEDTAPFGYSWPISSAQNGSHRWTAKAYAADGATAESAPVDLIVNIGASATPTPTGGSITATNETSPVPHSGDAADDPAIWIHPSDPGQSTVIGTDKLGGLAVYDLSGRQLYYYADGMPNNVDLRYDFPLGGQRVALVATSDRTTDSIRVYRVDSATRGLTYVGARTLSTGIGVAGLCMYVSPTTGKYYAFVGDNSGSLQQWELFDNGAGKVDATKVRTLSFGSTTEGCVADDRTGALYVSEEDVAIWRYGAEPGAGSTRTTFDGVGAYLSADIEGLAIYYGGPGYLIVSSQGSNDFAVYNLSGAFLGKFKVEAGSVDGVSYTDGLDVTNFGLGGSYASGLFVAQDDRNDGGNQNFKLVPWDRIARSFGSPLAVDTGYDQRTVGGGSGPAPTPTATATRPATPTASATAVPTNTPKPTATVAPTIAPTPTSTASPTSGTTYYVDSVAGNDSNAGTTQTAAWKSLAKADAAVLRPGDRLLFKRGGSWTGRLSIAESGTSGNRIVIGSYGTGALPVIQGSCVALSGSYVTLRELLVTNCSFAAIEITGNSNLVEASILSNSVAGIYVKSGAQSNRLIRNEIRNNNKMSVLTLSPTNDDSGAFGILLHGDYTEIANNTISGSDAFSYDYGRDGAAVEVFGGRNNHIHHNLAIDNDAFTELGNSRSADNTFAYNVVRSSLPTSIGVVTRGAKSSYGPVLRTRLYNNTIVLTGSSSQGFVCLAGCGPDILTMRNNIVQAVLKVGYADAAFVEDHNLFWGGLLQFTRGTTSLVANPLFLDGATGNFHLSSTSPAIDRGVSVGYSIDFDGAAVPTDGNGDGVAVPDLGAFEYRR